MYMKISIDGNIGCGKSTIIKLLNEKLDNNQYGFTQENISDWNVYLKEYYKDIKKNSLLFQMKVLLHHLSNKSQKKKIDIHERSPLSCINIFGKHLYNSNFLGDLDIKLMNSYNSNYGWIPDVIIYIKTSPEIVKNRIDLRSRDGETIPLSYLENISNLYDKLYISEKLKFENIKIYCIDGNNEVKIILDKILLIIKNL